MRSFLVLAGSLIGAMALFACSSDPAHPSPVGSAGANNSSAGSGAAGGVGGALVVGSGGASASVAGSTLDIDPDAGTIDDDAGTACSHLNIGILGKPGANASSNFQQWLVASGTSTERIQTSDDEPLTSASLQPFDVVILDWLTREYTPDEAAIFAAWVSAGGGVASMTGYNNTSSDWYANTLLAPLEVAYAGPLLNGPS